jgi:hypothetical protein
MVGRVARESRAAGGGASRIGVGLLAVVLVGCPSTVDPPATTITVEGLVLASEGTPLAGVLVHAQGELTTTEADGGFRLEGIEPPYTLTLGSGGTERVGPRLRGADERGAAAGAHGAGGRRYAS